MNFITCILESAEMVIIFEFCEISQSYRVYILFCLKAESDLVKSFLNKIILYRVNN